MPFDYSDSTGLIPDGTICILQMNVIAGQIGEDGMLSRSSTGSEMLSVKFIVVQGEFAKWEFWGNFVLDPSKERSMRISQGRLKAILDSAFNLRPDDKSDEARAKRNVSYRAFDGIRFVGKIGIEPAKDGYQAKNGLVDVITNDRNEWPGPVAQMQGTSSPQPTPTNMPAAPVERPKWAS